MHKLLLSIAFILFCLCAAAQADTRLSYAGADGPYTLSIRPDAIRIDRADGRWQLYVRASNTLFTVHPKQHSYTRMDTDTAADLRRQMTALRAKIETQLAQLPATKRRAARAALAEQLPGFAAPPQPVNLHDSGKTTFVAGRQCRLVDISRGDAPAGRVCVARAATLGLSSADHATLAAMFRFMHALLADSPYASASLPYLELKGVPIRFRAANGNLRRRLQQVSHAALPSTLFELPAAFSERHSPDAAAASP